jgi:GDPmannose 4,6-dehydratase
VRRISQPNFGNLAAVIEGVTLHTGDMTDGASLFRVIAGGAAGRDLQSGGHEPGARFLRSPRGDAGHQRRRPAAHHGGLPHARARRQDLSGVLERDVRAVQETPQTRDDAVLSALALWRVEGRGLRIIAKVWREAYGTRVSCGILFNHESPRRGEAFLSRKVCKAAPRSRPGGATSSRSAISTPSATGATPRNTSRGSTRSCSTHADDFVIATGETHSVREFVEAAFARVGIADWERYVEYDRSLTRPAEVDLLCGDASKSKRVLGFEAKVKFAELVNIMVDAEMAEAAADAQRRAARPA